MDIGGWPSRLLLADQPSTVGLLEFEGVGGESAIELKISPASSTVQRHCPAALQSIAVAVSAFSDIPIVAIRHLNQHRFFVVPANDRNG